MKYHELLEGTPCTTATRSKDEPRIPPGKIIEHTWSKMCGRCKRDALDQGIVPRRLPEGDD